MAEAVLTLSQTPNRTKHDHTADDFTVGRRVKAHPATVTFMRGDVYGTIQHISRGPKRLVLVKMDRSGKRLSLQLAIYFMLTNRPHHTQRACKRCGAHAGSNPNHKETLSMAVR